MHYTLMSVGSLKKKKKCMKNTEFCINTTWLLDVHYPFSNKRPLGTKWGFFLWHINFFNQFEEFCFAYVPYNILYVICLQILYGLCYFQHIWGLICDQHPKIFSIEFITENVFQQICCSIYSFQDMIGNNLRPIIWGKKCVNAYISRK